MQFCNIFLKYIVEISYRHPTAKTLHSWILEVCKPLNSRVDVDCVKCSWRKFQSQVLTDNNKIKIKNHWPCMTDNMVKKLNYINRESVVDVLHLDVFEFPQACNARLNVVDIQGQWCPSSFLVRKKLLILYPGWKRRNQKLESRFDRNPSFAYGTS